MVHEFPSCSNSLASDQRFHFGFPKILCLVDDHNSRFLHVKNDDVQSQIVNSFPFVFADSERDLVLIKTA